MKKLLSILLASTMILSAASMINVSATADTSANETAATQETTAPTETAEPTTEPNAPATEETATNKKNTYKDFTYSVNGNAITITKYTGSAKSVTVPATIDGKKVTTIGKKAFFENKKLEKVTISKNVTTIEREAFERCTKLRKVTYGKNVKKIHSAAFAGCKKLKSITLPSKLTSLNEGVFYNAGLTSIKIGDKIKSINPIALEIDSLKKITVAKNNKKFSSKDGVLYNKKQTKLLICPRALAKTTLTVSKKTKIVEYGAFNGNKNLKKVYFSKNLEVIYDAAFLSCKKLKSITVPRGVDIDDRATTEKLKVIYY